MDSRFNVPGLAIGLMTLLLAGRALADELDAGRAAFAICAACHSAAADAPPLIGPTLNGIVGRDIASIQDFAYTPALEGLSGAWSEAALDAFLAAPTRYAPGTSMGLVGIENPTERAAIIVYLRTLVPGAARARAEDPFGSDWPEGPGRAETGALCNACHSLAIVKQQRLPRARWEKLMDWMVEEQGMPAQAPATLDRILDYLAMHFGNAKATQRM